MGTDRATPQQVPPVSPALKALVGSTGRAKLLAHFFLHPGEAFHVRELARLLDESAGNLLRDLRRLEAIRLLQTERVGNQVRYSLDQAHPLYRDLQHMILKTTGVDAVLREALQPVRGIELAMLYGSFAKGTATSRSDLDLMIIGEVTDRALAPVIAKAEKFLGREVSYTRYPREEAREKIKQRSSFVRNVLAGPGVLVLAHRDDELFALARR
ncbi:MAG TPA: nucleotidyltransferase domain-containing protein [bacterium]|nr:nucleotidyltransferase domain-containing protein [bacterium]